MNHKAALYHDHTTETEGREYENPTVEIDTVTPPRGHVELVIHEHGPTHGNYGADALGTLRFTQAQAKRLAEELGWASSENAAEVMLLDWMSDAEIGEALFSVLYNIDKVRARLRTVISDTQGPTAEIRLDQAFADVQEARRMLAAHLQWIDEVCVREGRAPLGSYEQAALRADGDTAA